MKAGVPDIQNRSENPLEALQELSNRMRIPSHRQMHIVWLLCKAGYTEYSARTEFAMLGVQSNIFRIIRRRSAYWMAALTMPEKHEYERRARKALLMEENGTPELHDPIPHDESLFMGNWQQAYMDLGSRINDPSSSVRIGSGAPMTAGESGLPRTTEIQGMALPNIMQTIQEAEAAGVGMRDMIQKISEMLGAECVMVPGKVSWAKIPIQDRQRLRKGDTFFVCGADGKPTELEAYDDGVLVAGYFYDTSYICPDQETRSQGLKLAKAIIGNNDIDQLKKILTTIQATSAAENLDELQRKRLEQIKKDIAQGLDPTKEVGQKGGGITMTRPKQKTPEEFNKGKEE